MTKRIHGRGLIMATMTLAASGVGLLQGQRVTAAAAVPARSMPTAEGSLRIDAPARHVTYAVRAGVANAANPELNFNGAAMGEEELHVPVGWTVEVAFTNVGQAPHSMRLLSDAAIPVTVGPAVIRGAETPNGVTGLAPGASHTVRFTASRAGSFRLSCAVNAHGYAGMWVRVIVSPRYATAEVVHHPAAP